MSGLLVKSSPDLGMSTLGRNGYEMPPKAWSNLWSWGGPVNYKLALDTGTCCLLRIKLRAAAQLIFNTTWKEFRVESGNEAETLCSGENWSLDWYFQEPNLWAQFLYFLLSRNAWHPTPVLLPGKSHGQRSLVGYSQWGREESDTTERLHFHFSLSCIWEGNGNPLQCFCLENPRDGGAWWAAVYGVAQSWTWLKRHSSSSSSSSITLI